MAKGNWVGVGALVVVLAACGGGGTADDAGADGGIDARAAESGAPDLGSGGDAATDAGGDAGCRTDADGDGHVSVACGGDDCDDSDPNRYPGNHEVCDTANHDEDCDPRTFGFRDEDGDGFPDAVCCNTDPADGSMVCGTDCNDAAPSVHPTANETCNGIDDDCNGIIDDVAGSVYLDCDGDGFGDPAHSMTGCPHAVMTGECTSPAADAGWVTMGGDCNDASASVHPGATEVCNMVDDDCNTLVDDTAGGCDCTPPATRMCGSMVGSCHVGTEACIGGHWETACGGAYIGPTPESCNGRDDDCDGVVDNGVLVNCYRDADGDGYAATGAAVVTTGCSCSGLTTPTPPSGPNVDCDDTKVQVHPGAPELCDGIDTNCSSGGGPATAEDADGDHHTAVGFAGCSGGPYPKDDCCDSDANVHPGQTTPFVTMRGCGGGFDYNCDGAESGDTSVSGCSWDSDGCTGGCSSGWSGSAPACGGYGNYVGGGSCSYDCYDYEVACGGCCSGACNCTGDLSGYLSQQACL